MTHNDRLLYTAHVRTSGGRDGLARSDDGRLDVRLSTPGTPVGGTNPEQLFAAAWSACFGSAVDLAARAMNIALPAARTIDAEIHFCARGGSTFLRARLAVTLPGLARETAQRLVDAAHRTCAYSKAIHGNVDVEIDVV